MTKEGRTAETVSVHLPILLKEKIDELQAKGGYTSRSDVIRDIIREWFELKETERARVKRNLTK